MKRKCINLLAIVLATGFSLSSFSPLEVKASESGIVYKITGEAESGIRIDNQPISPYWFPQELLEWNPYEEENLHLMKGNVPLAERVSSDKLSSVNNSQSRDFKVMSLAIMNASTSGNPTQGSSQFDANTFSYWQYIDQLIYWSGSAGEGLIVAPSSDVIDSAHTNGVAVIGTVFFPQTEHGGKMIWLDEFLQKDAQGNFPMVQKLIDTALALNFDGWFFNQETQGTADEPLTKEHADLMREFIKEFKERAGDSLEIVWYDSMTVDGEMAWQNALTDKNSAFITNDTVGTMADSMFLNFWWTNNSLRSQDLLNKSREKAGEIGVDPYALYAGIDVQARGFETPIRWELFDGGVKMPYTSLGLYCPSWTYFSADSPEIFEAQENRFWVNEHGTPAETTLAQGTEWRGISTYAIEKTVVNKLPFTTDFNMGNGYSFFINGKKVSDRDWNNRAIMDIMPTYRWILDEEGNNNLTPSIDYNDAYYGGNSISLKGKMDNGKDSTLKLYSADLFIEPGTQATVYAKADASVNMALALELRDGSTRIIQGDKDLNSDWEGVRYNLQEVVGKTVKTISLVFTSEEEGGERQINIGNMSFIDSEAITPAIVAPENFKIDSAEFNDENYFGGIKFSWDSVEGAKQYEIYKRNSDGTKSFYGVTTASGFYLDALERELDESQSNFEVVAVNDNMRRSVASSVTLEWPRNIAPIPDFKVSKTLIAPGEAITFESLCGRNTESVIWHFEGADITGSTENNPVVTYSNEGVYRVSLIARNEAGANIKVANALIRVTNDAPEELPNLSEGKSTTASSFVNDNEAPAFAVDGDLSTKWCAVGSAPHDITIDLGEVRTVAEVYMGHAEAGGEGADMNTRWYTIETSLDGVNFTTVVENKTNTLGETVDTFSPTNARYIRVTAISPTQGADSAVRIYEIQARGL